jgi:hypothetical protein
MMPRRYRILLWAVPLLSLQWVAFAVIEPDGGGSNEFVSIGFFLGSIFGHATLAAAWAALGPGPIGWRVPLSLVWIVMLPIAIAINVSMNRGPDSAAVIIGASLLGQWLIVQLPLWALAIGYGLRLRHVDDWKKMEGRPTRQFSLRHLMVVTALVGVVLGIGRISVGWLIESYSRDHEAPIFIFLAVAAVVLTLPLLLAGLLRRYAISAVLLVLTLVGFVTAWEVTLLQLIPGGGGPGPQTGHFVGINAFTAATVLAGVLLVRLNGYETMDPKQANR